MTNLPHVEEGISPDEMFGKPVSVYPDAEALEDGTLVDITRYTDVRFRGYLIIRMTQPLFDEYYSGLEDTHEGSAYRFGLLLGYYLRAWCTIAERNLGDKGQKGDVYTLRPNMWLVRNEVGGWTAMDPEDY